jgi:CHASE2 domain-containing sensor protein
LSGEHHARRAGNGRLHTVFKNWLDDEPAELVVRVIQMIVPAALLLLLNPFNILDNQADRSEKVVGAIVSPFYPLSGSLTNFFYNKMAEDNRDKISVILITEEDVASSDIFKSHSWPPSLNDYATVLRILSKQRPAAIFVDLDIAHRSDAEKQNFFTQLKSINNKTPLFFACITREGAGAAPATETIQSISCQTPANDGGQPLPFQGVPVTWPRHGESYPLCVRGADATPQLSPAAQLRLKLAEHDSQESSLEWLKRQCDDKDATKTQAHASHGDVTVGTHEQHFDFRWMTVIWGASQPPDGENVGIYDDECEGAALDTFGQKLHATLSVIIRGFAVELLHHDEPQARPWNIVSPCAYHYNFSLKALQRAVADDKTMIRAFQGRVVIIGAKLPGTHDVWQSPVHGPVPAAHLHAMALDNLLNFGERKTTEMSHLMVHAGTFALELLFLIIPGLLVLAPAKRLIYPVPSAPAYTTVFLIYVAWGFLCAALCGIGATIAVLGFRWSLIGLPLGLCMALLVTLLWRPDFKARPAWLRAALFLAIVMALSLGAFVVFFVGSLAVSAVSMVNFATSPMFWLPSVIVAINGTLLEPLTTALRFLLRRRESNRTPRHPLSQSTSDTEPTS